MKILVLSLGGARGVIVIVVEMYLVTRFQILDWGISDINPWEKYVSNIYHFYYG